MNALESRFASLLKIPPEPVAPSGSEGSVRVFRAARPFLLYLCAQWAIAQIGSFFGIVIGLRFVDQIPVGFWSPLVLFFEALGIALYLLQLPITLLGVFLDFKLRWYMVTDRSLRIREGVFRVRERTMSFANIQNLSIRRGPLQQLLGISDVEVRSAGGGESSSSDDKSGVHDDLHRGLFRGVDNGEEIRDLILGHQRKLRDSGLGDPDDHQDPIDLPEPPPLRSAPASVPEPVGGEVGGDSFGAAGNPPAGSLAEAARQLVGEAAALRRTITG